MPPVRYFVGSGRDLGTVSASPHKSFAELCDALVKSPVALAVAREAYHQLPARERQSVKRVDYLTPAVFSSSPCPRKTENAVRCNLIALDVDDAKEATRLLEQPWDCLRDLAYLVWHTASSTPGAPRLRVLVSAEAIPIARYPAAVRTIGEMLGLATITRESLVPVQPMFVPTQFEGDVTSPIIAWAPDGDAFLPGEIIEAGESAMPLDNETASAEGSVADITFLRSPMEGITLADAESALEHLDPDMPMQQWIETAAALKHQFNSSPEALELWDKWSSKGKKYVDSDETAYRWSTLKAQPTDRAPVTIRSLFKAAQARGWSNPALARKGYAETLGWIQSPSRSTEELFDQGASRIAKVGSTIGQMERKSLMVALKDIFAGRKIAMPLPDIKKAVRLLEIESAKTTGIPAWAKGLCFVTAINMFYRHATDRQFAPEVLDLMYATPQIGDETPMRPRDYLIQVAGIQQVENLRYDPARVDDAGKPRRFYTEDGVPYVNTYRGGHAVSDPDSAEEAGAIFAEHVARLVREPGYGAHLLDFLAFHVQHPGRKVRWAPLIQGAQGCGKTAIAVAMSAVLGRRNVRKLTATDVLEGSHNGWAYGQQMVFMEEVRVVGTNRYAIMDRIKPLISDDEISLHCKYEAHRTVPNVANYMMFTNHHDALAINDADRRYFVIASPLQTPGHIRAMGGEAYFDRLFGMIRQKAGGLRSWLEQRVISPEFNPDGRAVMTPYLTELARNAATPLAAAVAQVIEDQPHALVRKDLVAVDALRGILDSDHLPPFTDQALAAVLRESGFVRVGRLSINGTKRQVWTNGLKGDARTVAEMRDEYL